MNKYPLIGVSIIAVVLLVLAALTNVVGYQTVLSSNQKVIKDEVNQKELLFQTILDIANNKEIQKIAFNSEMMRKEFFNPSIRFSVFTPHVLTKKYLNTAYHIGLILTKTISKSKIHSLLERYQVSYQGIQKEITAVIEKDAKLKNEITQLSNIKCDCENNNTTRWTFYILCTLLFPLIGFIAFIWVLSHYTIFNNLLLILMDISGMLNCW